MAAFARRGRSTIRSRLTKKGGGFNRSAQHLISDYRGEDVEDETAAEDLLHGNPESRDVGSLAHSRASLDLPNRLDVDPKCPLGRNLASLLP